MITFPDRLSGLIEQIEAGTPITPAEFKKVSRLQALDIAKAGEDFVREVIERENQQTEFFKTL